MGHQTKCFRYLSKSGLLLTILLIGGFLLPGMGTAAFADSPTVNGTVNAGSLSETATGPYSFSGTPGSTATFTMPFSVSDTTGGAAGWNLTITSVQLTSGAHTIPVTASTITRRNGCLYRWRWSRRKLYASFLDQYSDTTNRHSCCASYRTDSRQILLNSSGFRLRSVHDYPNHHRCHSCRHIPGVIFRCSYPLDRLRTIKEDSERHAASRKEQQAISRHVMRLLLLLPSH